MTDQQMKNEILEGIFIRIIDKFLIANGLSLDRNAYSRTLQIEKLNAQYGIPRGNWSIFWMKYYQFGRTRDNIFLPPDHTNTDRRFIYDHIIESSKSIKSLDTDLLQIVFDYMKTL